MVNEYLTAEYRLELPGKPLTFRFADDSTAKANHLQEFLNRQAAKGWHLLAIVPLAYDLTKPPKVPGAFVLRCCRLIFQHASGTSSDSFDIDPPPGRKLQPV